MTATAHQASNSRSQFSFSSWGASFIGACLLTLLIALLLALAHRPPHYETDVEMLSSFSVQNIDVPPQTQAASAQAPAPSDFSKLLPPTSVLRAPTVKTDAPPMETSMDVSEMIQWRYGYADLGRTSQATGSFGRSNLSSLDGGLENIIIPSVLFPQRLIDSGIYKGNVVVTLLIDINGHATVKNVHSASHSSLIDPVLKSMNKAIYSIPEKNGRPTSTLIRRNVIFHADAERVSAHQNKLTP